MNPVGRRTETRCYLRAGRAPEVRGPGFTSAFLAAFRETASVRAAAKTAGIATDRHLHWLEEDPRYWEAFTDAQQEVADALQGEAIDRAVNGWLEPILYRDPTSWTFRPTAHSYWWRASRKMETTCLFG
jgi:hypothetical protein